MINIVLYIFYSYLTVISTVMFSIDVCVELCFLKRHSEIMSSVAEVFKGGAGTLNVV